jgi:hypothetical protein
MNETILPGIVSDGNLKISWSIWQSLYKRLDIKFTHELRQSPNDVAGHLKLTSSEDLLRLYLGFEVRD